MLKKLLCLLLCLAMLSGLSACGGIGDGEGTTTADGTTTDNIETTTPEEVTTPDPLEVLIPPADVERDWVTILNGKEVKGITEEELEAYAGEMIQYADRFFVCEKDGQLIVAQVHTIREIIEIQSFPKPEPATAETVAQIEKGMSVFDVIRLLGMPKKEGVFPVFPCSNGESYLICWWTLDDKHEVFWIKTLKEHQAKLDDYYDSAVTSWTTEIDGEFVEGMTFAELSEQYQTEHLYSNFYETADGKILIVTFYDLHNKRVRSVDIYEKKTPTVLDLESIKEGMTVHEMVERIGAPTDIVGSGVERYRYLCDDGSWYGFAWTNPAYESYYEYIYDIVYCAAPSQE